MTPARQVFRRQELIQKQSKYGGRGERMEGREGGRALFRAQQKLEALTPGRFQLDLVVQVHPACPSPTCPKRRGSSAKTHSTCLQLQPAARPGGRAGPRGRRLHSPGTQRLRTPPEGGGTCRSGGRGMRDNGKFQRHQSPKLTHPRRHSPCLPQSPGLRGGSA